MRALCMPHSLLKPSLARASASGPFLFWSRAFPVLRHAVQHVHWRRQRRWPEHVVATSLSATFMRFLMCYTSHHKFTRVHDTLQRRDSSMSQQRRRHEVIHHALCTLVHINHDALSSLRETLSRMSGRVVLNPRPKKGLGNQQTVHATAQSVGKFIEAFQRRMARRGASETVRFDCIMVVKLNSYVSSLYVFLTTGCL